MEKFDKVYRVKEKKTGSKFVLGLSSSFVNEFKFSHFFGIGFVFVIDPKSCD